MRKAVWIIVALAIAAMIVTPADGILGKYNFQEKERVLPNGLVKPISIDNIPAPKATEGKEIPLTIKHAPLPADIPVATTEELELYPTLAVDGSGGIFGAYTLQPSIFETNIIYTFSGDGGTTWEDKRDTLSWDLEGAYGYPAIDYWGSGNTFVGTFKPDPSDCDGAAEYILRVGDPTDLETWSLVYYDFTGYYVDRESPDIAGYSDVGDATWFYGVMATTVDATYEQSGYIPGEDVPCLSFPNYNSEGSEWTWWFSWETGCYENSAHACIDIDRSNGMMYAAWDWYNESAPEKGRDIFLATADVHDWWVEEWNLDFSTLGGTENNTYPDIAAENGYIYIASQAEIMSPGRQDIICFYSHDGGVTWEVSTIAADSAKDEMYPSIVAYGDRASCIFTFDGDLYVSHTNDGGVTWSISEKVNDETGTVSMEYRTAKVATSGHTFWTDNRNGNADVYYDNVGASGPILSIESISGGFGVRVTIKNAGTADAENVEWSIVFDGPVFIGKEKGGTVTIPAGGEATIKSGFIFGIGSATITVTISGASKTASGFVLGPLVLGIK